MMRQIETQCREQHLDTMIKLAFDWDDAEEIQRILAQEDQELNPQEQAFADEILSKALLKADKQSRCKRRRRYADKARRIFPRVIEIAACAVLAAAVAAPIALAGSASFRAKVMQLLLEMDHEKGEAYFRFEQDPDASFDVPQGWRGNYYPSYIPDGYQIYEFDPTFFMAEYRNSQQDQLFYQEFDENSELMAGIEGSCVRSIQINGRPGYIIEGTAQDGNTDTITITWVNDANWFSRTGFGLSSEQMLQIAAGVKKIIK